MARNMSTICSVTLMLYFHFIFMNGINGLHIYMLADLKFIVFCPPDSRSTLVPCDAQNTSLCSWAEVVYKSVSSPFCGEKDGERVCAFTHICVVVFMN